MLHTYNKMICQRIATVWQVYKDAYQAQVYKIHIILNELSFGAYSLIANHFLIPLAGLTG